MPRAQEKVSAGENQIGFAGKLPNGMQYAARVQVAAEGGAVTVEGDQLVFRGCDSLTLTLAAETDYLLDYSRKWKGADPDGLAAVVELREDLARGIRPLIRPRSAPDSGSPLGHGRISNGDESSAPWIQRSRWVNPGTCTSVNSKPAAENSNTQSVIWWA